MQNLRLYFVDFSQSLSNISFQLSDFFIGLLILLGRFTMLLY